MNRHINTTLGDLISVIYDEFLDLYRDKELASVATAAVINDMLSETESTDEPARIAA